MKIRILGCGTSTGVPRLGSGWGDCDPNEPRNRRLRSSILIESAGDVLLGTVTHAAIAAERAMLAVLDGSCRTPVGALSGVDDGLLSLKGEILSMDGQTIYRAEVKGTDPVALGEAVGRDLLAQAGAGFLEQWNR